MLPARVRAPKARAPLHSVKAGSPLQIVATDIVGPFPESQAGNSYILVVADYFTRCMDRGGLRHPQSRSHHSRQEAYRRFSPPEQLHSDQGRQFESEVIAKVCKLLGIAKTRTTPCHPQSDGLVERFNRTLLSMLATAAEERPFAGPAAGGVRGFERTPPLLMEFRQIMSKKS